MRRRSRHPAPDDPTQWIGQPYTPHDPYYYITGPGRFRSLTWIILRNPRYCCLGAGITLSAWAAMIIIGFIVTNGPGFWVLLALIGAAIIGTLAGAASARRSRQAHHSHRHHKHHQTS